MSGVYKALAIAIVALLTTDAVADVKKAEIERQVDAIAVADEAEFALKMAEAEKRLAEAARQVAELSSSRLESYGDHGRWAYELSDRPLIGINIDGSGEDGPVAGVTIISVTPGGAAADGGLRAGDVLVSVNGESMSASSAKKANEQLFEYMQGVREGDTVSLEYVRGGRTDKVEIKPRRAEKNVFVWADDEKIARMPRMPNVRVAPEVGERFRFSFGGWSNGWGDMEVVEMTEGLSRYFGTDKGLLVINAPKTSNLKLQEGDVIQSIDGREPSSVVHCMRILGSYQPGETLELKIMRDKRRETLKVEMPERRSDVVEPFSAPSPGALPLLPQPPSAAPDVAPVNPAKPAPMARPSEPRNPG
jgi:S1-C subfamily serine protease